MDLIRCGMETQPSGREPSGIHPRRRSRTARDLLRKHERLSETVLAFPVPIEAIVEQMIGLRVVCGQPAPARSGTATPEDAQVVVAQRDDRVRRHPTEVCRQ